jgi:hypothetical protein
MPGAIIQFVGLHQAVLILLKRREIGVSPMAAVDIVKARPVGGVF